MRVRRRRGSRGTKPNTRPDERLRQTISKGLVAAGRQEEARIVALSGSRLTPVTAPFLRTWKIYRVDYRQSSHPVLLHVATGGGRVELLTGAPSAFGKVTAADGTTVGDAATAAALARTYVETTRPGGVLTYVVGRVEDIKFRPGITGAAAKHRDEIVSRYRSRIKARRPSPRARTSPRPCTWSRTRNCRSTTSRSPRPVPSTTAWTRSCRISPSPTPSDARQGTQGASGRSAEDAAVLKAFAVVGAAEVQPGAARAVPADRVRSQRSEHQVVHPVLRAHRRLPHSLVVRP